MNSPPALRGTFIHCSVEVSLYAIITMIVIESLLSLRGNPLCVHVSEGGGKPPTTQLSAKVRPSLKVSKGLLGVFTLGGSTVCNIIVVVTVIILY